MTGLTHRKFGFGTVRGRASALTAVCLAALTGACGDDGSSGGYYGTAGLSGGDYPPPEEQADPKQDPQTQDGEPTCDEATPVALFLSPDDSNSTSSAVQVREAVLSGWNDLSAVPLRTWEFLNYYTFNYPRAEAGMVTVTPELARVDGAPEGQYVLQIGVAAQSIANADRPLMNVTLVLDESGSMTGAPMDMQREVCRQIAASLRAGDVVSMVGWDTENAIKLAGHVVTGPSDPKVVGECDALSPGGGTDLNGGLRAGYELAHEHYDQSRINRVVLISDGGANAGVTDVDIIAGGAGDKDKDGIYLVGVGVGTADTYNDYLMDVVTDHGRGASLFVATAAEANKMFGERFVQTMAVAVRDVRVRLDLPPGFSIVKFSGEEFSSDPTEIEPQHLAPNDVMVFHQTIETCAPALVDDAAEFTVNVKWKDAVNFEERELTVTKKIKEALGAETAMLRKGAAVFAYAEALKAYRGDKSAASLEPAFTALDLAAAVLPGDAELAEMSTVLGALK